MTSQRFRFACDTGGTFTDLLVESDQGLRMYKAHTVAGDPAKGVLDALTKAAIDHGLELRALLEAGELFVHGTTHAINAIVMGRTAKTALLATQGHTDVLVLREGGRTDPFDHTVPYPDPYVPRALTFGVPERIDASGAILTKLDEARVVEIAKELVARGVEAVAIAFLWSIVNPTHELRVAELLHKHAPGVAITCSHALNPTLREYRRTSAAAIDASLKPLMTRYLGGIEERLRDEGFSGRVLVLTSQGGAMAASALAAAPIHAINSGPSLAPVAGRYHAAREGDGARNVVVADTGGTTYDVSLVRDGFIPWTRETWIGAPYRGHMTGFPSVDVKSVGAGGGSIAWVDSGGVLHVGPQSAGANPGPACYGKGGTKPTVTDASVVLGHLDPDYFLGGSVTLDAAAARAAIQNEVASKLGLSIEEAANAILDLVTENMVQAIVDITVNQGVDASDALLIGGGGAAGLNSVAIARRLGCATVLFPETGAALSASGALISDLTAEFRRPCFTATDRFDFDEVMTSFAALAAEAHAYEEAQKGATLGATITFAVEARYPNQVWDLEVPLEHARFNGPADVETLRQAFHAAHRQVFAIDDPNSAVELVALVARVRCALRDRDLPRLGNAGGRDKLAARKAWFQSRGWCETPVLRIEDLVPGQNRAGPAIVETPFTTIVIDPGARFRATQSGGLAVDPAPARVSVAA
ncbi:hydantoinase/oxoprolinase family protein [Roseiterribacter gracilis]|uniref:5-oxoprolinase n=1 Tax=Roseiterribacter gracilis TaxID=2812848 RepID=A0A8S8X881_9PROT|nr:5-oxoprolinase [Rhodospirillales bacterium TMPK1]